MELNALSMIYTTIEIIFAAWYPQFIFNREYLQFYEHGSESVMLIKEKQKSPKLIVWFSCLFAAAIKIRSGGKSANENIINLTFIRVPYCYCSCWVANVSKLFSSKKKAIPTHRGQRCKHNDNKKIAFGFYFSLQLIWLCCIVYSTCNKYGITMNKNCCMHCECSFNWNIKILDVKCTR